MDHGSGLSASQLTTELLDDWGNLLAFALSFAVIGRLWVVHHRFFAEVDAFDGRLLGLNLLYLASIVLIPGVFMLSIPLAFVVPRAAAYLWFLLFLDPSKRLVRRSTSEAEP